MNANLTLNHAYYFGTFNPVHNGHLQIAQAALTQFKLDAIIFVPAGEPPFKNNNTDLISAKHRLTMLTLAVLQGPQFQISTMELERQGLSYTADSLIQLCEEQGLDPRGHHIPFIVGSDALSSLSGWHQPQAVIDACHFLQAPRSTKTVVKTIELNGIVVDLETTPLAMDNIDLSSTAIRQAVQQGLPINSWCPDVVVNYVKIHRLYQ